jgi:prepilin-type N-terminal cleavage/methylation domain-containing protein
LALKAGMAPALGDRRNGSRFADAFSLVELSVVLAIMAAVALAAAPTLVRYWDNWSLQAAARELASTINLGRQLAIGTRSPVCVDLNTTGLRFRVGGCAGDVWTGPVTDASGIIPISDPATLAVSANARLVFTTLGAASPAATYTVRHTRTHASRAVVVAGSGRISVE